MRQVQKARNQLDSQAQWIQLGLLGAGILAPLINRWNELRALERTRELREDIEERWQSIQASSPWNRLVSRSIDDTAMEAGGEAATRRSLRSGTALWTLGVGLGITAAGIGTYMLVKRRMADAHDKSVVPLPFRRPEGDDYPAAAAPATMEAGTAPWAQAADALAASESEDSADQSYMPDVDPGAAVVGNIRTMVYHLVGDENLPAEDNRIYFSSEEEARRAGYHLHTTQP